MDWDKYDAAYASAPSALPDSFLTPPANCTFGCVPLKKKNATALVWPQTSTRCQTNTHTRSSTARDLQ